jgi:HD-GYP domain-containing protein (c-di-GMP phosphodiesterase class II)
MQHSQRVAAYCRLIGINFGLHGRQLAELEVGALLHDIGKVAVPQNVIEKPGRLTDDEWRVMKLHPAIGANLLSEIPDCAAESDIVLCHHERFDGIGYPNGLRGREIPLGARIFAVADTLDAMFFAAVSEDLATLGREGRNRGDGRIAVRSGGGAELPNGY